MVKSENQHPSADLSVSFDDRLSSCFDRIGPAERRVARYIQANREEALVSSASVLARRAGTSDATVVRTAKALGFQGLDALRKSLAVEMREATNVVSPAVRVARTLGRLDEDDHRSSDFGGVLASTMALHREALETLERVVTPEAFSATVRAILAANRVFIFGIGPSSAMADYAKIQFRRFGLEAESLTDTGLLLADGLGRLRGGDLLIMLAYGRVYPELEALLEHADRSGVPKILVSDTLGTVIGQRVDRVLSVPRGRVDLLSMHTATLALIEALLVALAAGRPVETLESLSRLNRLRHTLTGKALDLPNRTDDSIG
jgi:DNA-binding MurR/RpiR family transcriptional regulator